MKYKNTFLAFVSSLPLCTTKWAWKASDAENNKYFFLVRESAETQEDPMGDDLFISLRVPVRWLRVHVTLSQFQWGPSSSRQSKRWHPHKHGVNPP